ncbi:hypothetical protein ACQU0X_13985 [Pseudovibrio ascidiaceicola]|uniref:hypothetical protein n=1 Tax=Pseudovibrio ascidiaceicola TaxID=285279 RepID=UPI003D3618E1
MLRHSNNNMFSLMEMLSQNYAKAYKDYCETSHGFMPFMQKEGAPSGKSETKSAGVSEFPYMNWADPSKWQGVTGLPQQAMLSQVMSMFSGDKNISAAMQRHLSRKDAMNVESWMELMPILLMLSYGNMVKNYLAGPQRTMMEAYLQGFAKGCPEFHQDTDAARNPILDAREAFWSQMMPLENPMLEFWANALQGTSSASGDHSEPSEKSTVQNTRAKKTSAPVNGSGNHAQQSTAKETHKPSSMSEGLAAMQQAQGEAWQQYCNVFWPTRSHR